MANPAARSNSSGHRWKFFRAGGFDQVKIESAADLANLGQLDQKLWVALACPTRGIEFDNVTLDLIDSDKDGRIRPPELIAACKWAAGCLKNGDSIARGGPLSLSNISEASAEGKALLASAKQVLANLGKADATSISVAETSDTVKIFAQTNFNGDGIVPADAADDAAVKAVIGDVIGCLGGITDRSGKPGVDQGKVDAFFGACQAHSDWWKKAESDAGILVLGDKTAAASAAMRAVRAKVDDYFARCRMVSFDGRAGAALNRSESEYLDLAAKDLSITAAEVAHFPLAKIEAGKALPLKDGVNPAWSTAMAALAADAVKPILGEKSALSEADWLALCAKLAPYGAWCAGKAGAEVEKLGQKRVREILSGKSKDAIAALIARDKALEPEAGAIAGVDKLARFHRDLNELVTNYVNFADFYEPAKPAVFQSGTLYLDERSCNLCIRVADMGRWDAMANLSRFYIAYCDCVRKVSGETMRIAAAFTDGDSDNLMVGRNGIFYDRQGRDWDATIAKIVDNPISIRQAFWAPYKKIAAMIEGAIEKLAASKDKAVTDAAGAKVDAGAAATAAVAPPAKKEPFDVAKFAGVFAAIGLAIGMIGGILVSIAGGFAQLALWQILPALIGMMLAISGPSMLLAWLKLRQRNLGPVLDANGWAVNAKAKVNVPFGRMLTDMPVKPAGSSMDASDPYTQSESGRKFLLAGLILFQVIAMWWGGLFNSFLPERFQHASPAPADDPAAAEADVTAVPAEAAGN